MQKDPGLLQEGDSEIDGDLYDNIDKLIEDASNGSSITKRLLTTNIMAMLISDGSERARECLAKISIMQGASARQLSLFKL